MICGTCLGCISGYYLLMTKQSACLSSQDESLDVTSTRSVTPSFIRSSTQPTYLHSLALYQTCSWIFIPEK